MSHRRKPVPPPVAAPAVSRRLLYATVLMGAGALAAVLVLVSVLVNRNSVETAAAPALAGAADTRALFAGIPQRGNVLGSPRAPVTLVEYADLQCPYCADFSRSGLPGIVEEYVRPGRVRVEFRGLAFVGPESVSALRVTLAAATQNKLFEVMHLIYENQGAENSGWVTDELLRGVLAALPPLDAERAFSERTSAAVAGELTRLRSAATADRVQGTPAFFVGPTGGALSPLKVSSLETAAFRPAIDALLAG